MKSVAYVVGSYPSLSETFIAREIEAAARAGCRLTVLSLRRPDVSAAGFEVPDGVEVFYEEGPRVGVVKDLAADPREALRWARAFVGALRRPAEAPKVTAATAVHAARAVPKLVELIRRRGITHVHAHFAGVPAAVGIAAARAAGVGASFAAHAQDVFVPEPGFADKARAARFVVACSRMTAEYLKRHLPPSAAWKVRALYHGLRLDRWAWSPPRPLECGRSFRIAAVGRLVPKKGFKFLVRALAVARGRYALRVIGGGPERSSLALEIGRLGLAGRVRLEGPRPLEAARRAIGGADLLVAPSVVDDRGDRDVIPNVLLEAMALGTPVVASRVGAIDEVVRPGRTGWLVEPGRPEELARAIDEAAADDQARLERATAARALVERSFDVDRNAARLVGMFG